MDTFSEHVARAILFAAAVIAMFILQVLPSADGVLLLHHQVLIALLAAALLAAALFRPIRASVVAVGLLSQAGFVASALAMPGFSGTTVLYLNLAGLGALLLVGFLLLRSARQQARWDGLPAPQRGG